MYLSGPFFVWVKWDLCLQQGGSLACKLELRQTHARPACSDRLILRQTLSDRFFL